MDSESESDEDDSKSSLPFGTFDGLPYDDDAKNFESESESEIAADHEDESANDDEEGDDDEGSAPAFRAPSKTPALRGASSLLSVKYTHTPAKRRADSDDEIDGLGAASATTKRGARRAKNKEQRQKDQERLEKQRAKAVAAALKAGRTPVLPNATPSTAADDGGDFDEVAAESDPDVSDDPEAIAQRLAMGQMLLRKRTRDDLVEGGYNRYTFADDESLPQWFLDDENKHNKPALPISKEDVNHFKQQLAALNTRPIKKIAEAKARKKDRTAKRWEKIKSMADEIAKSNEGTSAQKLKQIQGLYFKSAAKKPKQERVYVVSKRGGGLATSKPAKRGAKMVRVDGKMKKDKRALRRAEKRKDHVSKSRNRKRQKMSKRGGDE